MYISFTYSLCPVPRPPPFLVFAATAQMPGAPGGHGSALTAGTTAQIDSLPSAEPDGSLVSPGGPPGTADSVAGGAGPTGSTQGVGGSAGPAAGAAVTTLVYVQRVATLGNHPYPACTLSSVRVAPRVGGGAPRCGSVSSLLPRKIVALSVKWCSILRQRAGASAYNSAYPLLLHPYPHNAHLWSWQVLCDLYEAQGGAEAPGHASGAGCAGLHPRL
jgi:hypothetical protein